MIWIPEKEYLDLKNPQIGECPLPQSSCSENEGGIFYQSFDQSGERFKIMAQAKVSMSLK